jgi:hypothetical protein
LAETGKGRGGEIEPGALDFAIADRRQGEGTLGGFGSGRGAFHRQLGDRVDRVCRDGGRGRDSGQGGAGRKGNDG